MRLDRLDTEATLDLNRTLLALVTLLLGILSPSCRSSGPQGFPPESLTPIPKPWTRAAVEACEFVYVETAKGRKIVIPGPTIASDESGEHLTKKDDPSRRVALLEVTRLDAIDPDTARSALEQAANPPSEGPPKQALAASFLALWGAVLLFLPAVAAYLILA